MHYYHSVLSYVGNDNSVNTNDKKVYRIEERGTRDEGRRMKIII